MNQNRIHFLITSVVGRVFPLEIFYHIRLESVKLETPNKENKLCLETCKESLVKPTIFETRYKHPGK